MHAIVPTERSQSPLLPLTFFPEARYPAVQRFRQATLSHMHRPSRRRIGDTAVSDGTTRGRAFDLESSPVYREILFDIPAKSFLENELTGRLHFLRSTISFTFHFPFSRSSENRARRIGFSTPHRRGSCATSLRRSGSPLPMVYRTCEHFYRDSQSNSTHDKP